MKRREDELFAAARAWNPVDRPMLARVEQRLAGERRDPARGRIWVAAMVSLAAVYLGLTARPSPEMAVLAEAPAVRRASEVRQTKYKQAAGLRCVPSNARACALRWRYATAKRGSISHVARTAAVGVQRISVEQPPPAATEVAVAPSPAAPKRYLPRAIAEFQQLDWRRLEQSDELPAYVRAIIHRRDRGALLAALDRIDVARELRLVRGELRAGEDRCSEATADFDAILSDSAAPELHPRAADGLERCR